MKTLQVECHMIVHIISPTPPASVVIGHTRETISPPLHLSAREAASLRQPRSPPEMCVMRSSNSH